MKQHPIYTHLLISETGEVYSTKTNKYMKTLINKGGYEVFHTKLNGRQGSGILMRVHRLVADTYLLNPNNKPHVNHLDGDKQNNNLTNLEWVTAKENAIHARDLGLTPKLFRERNGKYKGSSELCLKVADLVATGLSLRAIGRILNVSHNTIARWCAAQNLNL